MSRSICAAMVAAAAIVAAPAVARSAVFASSVSSYTPGTGVDDFQTAAAAAGAPHGIVGQAFFPAIMSPFNPPYEADEIVGIGLGGSITLRFPVPVNNVAGADFGVFTNAGLIDASTTFPGQGVNTNPAGVFGGRSATVEVSGNGTDFSPLGVVRFELPSNYYANAATPYDTAAPANALLADFGQPFTGSLATFDGLNWPATLAALAGSGGGTWIDFGSTGLGSIVAVRFSLGTTPPAGSDGKFFIDAVAANNVAVPEPAALAVFAVVPLLSRRR